MKKTSKMWKLIVFCGLFLQANSAPKAPKCNFHDIFQSPRENYESNCRKMDQHQILERSNFPSDDQDDQPPKPSPNSHAMANAHIRLNLQPFCPNSPPPFFPPPTFGHPFYYPPPFYYPHVTYPGQYQSSFHSYSPYAPPGYFPAGGNCSRDFIPPCCSTPHKRKSFDIVDVAPQVVEIVEHEPEQVPCGVDGGTTDIVDVVGEDEVTSGSTEGGTTTEEAKTTTEEAKTTTEAAKTTTEAARTTTEAAKTTTEAAKTTTEEATTATPEAPTTQPTTAASTEDATLQCDVILTEIQSATCLPREHQQNNLTLSNNLRFIPVNISESKKCPCECEEANREPLERAPYEMFYNPWFYPPSMDYLRNNNPLYHKEGCSGNVN